MQKSTSGFTIVELIVIVVVIGIIAAIAIVSYGNFQTQTQNEERLTELRGWQSTFEKYKAANGQYPVVETTSTYYCLGTGFPNQTCSYSNGGTEANAASLMNKLAPYDPPPPGPRTSVSPWGAIGPYAYYTSSYILLSTVIVGKGDNLDNLNCPSDMSNNSGAYGGGKASRQCTIQLSR